MWRFGKAAPAMNDSMLPLPGLSPVCGKTIVAKFDGGVLSSDGGVEHPDDYDPDFEEVFVKLVNRLDPLVAT
jgi:hypothetical protein